MTTAPPRTTTSKPHFPVLDGLRGIAAICVVIFHFSEMVIWDYSKFWIGHGFLAVDFFFCLSGFVIGYAYDDRIARIGLGSFLKARLIRLHPLVIFGSILGLITFYASPYAHQYSAARIALIFVASILLIPYGAMPERGRNLFGLNAPAWSLFWEYVANLVFAIVLYRLPRLALAALTLLAAAWLCWTGHHAGDLIGGWSSTNFWDGGARVSFSFCAGLLVYRSNWRPRTPLGLPGLGLLLVLALVMPYAKGAWVREAAVIILYFPLLVALGAGAVTTPATDRLCRISGELSYPLYMTHYAVMWVWSDYALKHSLATRGFGVPAAIGVVAMIAVGWTTFKLYDQPVRAYLSARFQ